MLVRVQVPPSAPTLFPVRFDKIFKLLFIIIKNLICRPSRSRKGAGDPIYLLVSMLVSRFNFATCMSSDDVGVLGVKTKGDILGIMPR